MEQWIIALIQLYLSFRCKGLDALVLPANHADVCGHFPQLRAVSSNCPACLYCRGFVLAVSTSCVTALCTRLCSNAMSSEVFPNHPQRKGTSPFIPAFPVTFRLLCFPWHSLAYGTVCNYLSFDIVYCPSFPISPSPTEAEILVLLYLVCLQVYINWMNSIQQILSIHYI